MDQVEQLRTQEQRLLGNQMQNRGNLVLQQVRSYKALEVENDKGKDMRNVASIRDKEKTKGG